jgi:hypothetical protein
MLPKPVAARVADPDLRPIAWRSGILFERHAPAAVPISVRVQWVPRHPGDEAACRPKHAGRAMGGRDGYRFATPNDRTVRQSPEGLRGNRFAK